MTIDIHPIPATVDPKTRRILAASEQLFLEHGYAATSMYLVSLLEFPWKSGEPLAFGYAVASNAQGL